MRALFDQEWYLAQYPDVAEAGVDPFAHFMRIGGLEGRNPHPLFQTAYYLEQEPRARQPNINPLQHFVENVANTHISPCPLFDIDWYLAQRPAGLTLNGNPILHYLEWRMTEPSARRASPHPIFNETHYLLSNPDVADSGMDPLVHFMSSGRLELHRQPNPLFDSLGYASQHPELVARWGDPVTAYLREGMNLGHSPHALFDAEWYAEENGNLRRRDAYLHYMRAVQRGQPDPNPLFDSAWYLDSHSNRLMPGETAIGHYLRCGWTDGLSPHPLFNATWYRQRYHGLLAPGQEPLAHYLSHGRASGLWPNALFDPHWYRSQYLLPQHALEVVDYFKNQQRRNPNPLFDTRFYLSQLEGPRPPSFSALADYMRRGGRKAPRPHPLFDAKWYARTYLVDDKSRDPLEDFLHSGIAADRNPNPAFDSSWYRRVHNLLPDDAPILHYIAFGAGHGLSPHWLFDVAWYESRNPLQNFDQLTALGHYLLHGAQTRVDPHPAFQTEWFLNQSPMRTSGHTTALELYLAEPMEKRRPNPLFDPGWYLSHYKDVAAAGADPLAHYLSVANNEDRDPCSVFFSRWYLETYPDVALAGANPMVDFLRTGASFGRDPNPLFDVPWYRRTYLNSNTDINPLVHWLETGLSQGYRPHPLFDAAWHAQMYPDPSAPDRNPLSRYLRHGARAGQLAHPDDYRVRLRDAILAGDDTAAKRFQDLQQSLFPPDQPITDTRRYALGGVLDEIVRGSGRILREPWRLEPSFLPAYPYVRGDNGTEKARTIPGLMAYAAAMKDVTVVGSTRFIITSAGRALHDELDRHWDDQTVAIKSHHAARAPANSVVLSIKRQPNTRITAGVHLMNEHANNYFHVMAELLPKLELIERSNVPPHVPLLINKGLHPNFLRLLDLANFRRRPVIELENQVAYRVGELYWCADPSGILDVYQHTPIPEHTYVSHQHLLAVRDRILNHLRPVNHPNPRKLFLRRGKTYRALDNEQELEIELMRRGFDLVNLTDISIESQIELFNSASIVVAATGAACTGAAWCQPGTDIVVLAADHPSTNLEVWRHITAAAGVRMHAIYGRRLMRVVNIYSVHDDYEIDMGTLTSMLDDL